jgi:hypothetical protein
MDGLPPHNQRRLNAKIAEIYGDRYADWHDLAEDLMHKGATLEMLASQFSALGISVRISTIHNWLKDRKRATP